MTENDMFASHPFRFYSKAHKFEKCHAEFFGKSVFDSEPSITNFCPILPNWILQEVCWDLSRCSEAQRKSLLDKGFVRIVFLNTLEVLAPLTSEFGPNGFVGRANTNKILIPQGAKVHFDVVWEDEELQKPDICLWISGQYLQAKLAE